MENFDKLIEEARKGAREAFYAGLSVGLTIGLIIAGLILIFFIK